VKEAAGDAEKIRIMFEDVSANQSALISDDVGTLISDGKIYLALKRLSLYTERLHPFVCNQIIRSNRSVLSVPIRPPFKGDERAVHRQPVQYGGCGG
jgi:hypothetical protein